MPKINEIGKWRIEIELAEKFREEEFGEYTRDKISKAGYNIEYFEKGYSGLTYQNEDAEGFALTTLNLFHAITKNIVPSLLYKNPKILAFPKKINSQDSAPLAQETLNYYYREINAEDVNNRVIWDAYVLGYGVSKKGYATKFGMDIPDEKKKKTFKEKALEAIGLRPKEKEEEQTNPEVNLNIISESPYVSYVSPFNFGKDPRATCLDDCMYVYEKFRKTVKQMKDNPKYKNTATLRGDDMDLPTTYAKGYVSDMDEFRMLWVYEIHYRSDDGIYLLVISKDGNEYKEHYHEKSIYHLKGWQYDELNFNKHGHKLYPISDMTKIRHLQDRFTMTIDAILEQVDRFVPKIAYDESKITAQGKLALRDGDLGSLVGVTGDPNHVFKEIALTQVKGDLKALADELVNLITIQTGLTRAQLTGVSQSETATEAQITQGGQTIRLSDMSNEVNKYLKLQATGLWDIITQFVELEQLELINGVSGIDQETGKPKYNWLTVNDEMGEQLRTGHYDFDIEVGSTQKPDLISIRKQFENMFNILARTDVIALIQQQGKKVDLAELLRLYISLFPEMTKDVGKIIQNITPQTTGLVDPAALNGNAPGGTTQGSNFNSLERQQFQGLPQEMLIGQ